MRGVTGNEDTARLRLCAACAVARRHRVCRCCRERLDEPARREIAGGVGGGLGIGFWIADDVDHEKTCGPGAIQAEESPTTGLLT
jgi:hypothetical protein